MCVELSEGGVKWSPVKVSRKSMRVSSSSDSEDIEPDKCLSFDCQVKHGVPGFEVEILTVPSGPQLHLGHIPGKK